jgi:2-polyprenyl-6-methoxyphenol hydroxylase-like FAD-dependent oxidoreductase
VAGDAPLKALRHAEVWERVARAIPHVAHRLDGEPLTDVLAMAGVLDRRRRFFVDGDVAVTGVVAVGDSWACTNPTAARGLSLGLMHAVALRDVLRETAGEPCATALRLDEVT